jgi:predicted O-methyltransferase YrrM
MKHRTDWNDQSWARQRAKRDFWVGFFSKLYAAGIFRIPKGHYYSPVVSVKEVRSDAARIFDTSLRDLAGIDLNREGQLALVQQLAEFYGDQPFGEIPREGLRYFFDNLWFARADALFLFCIIRLLRPRQIIEIGSGFSSAVMLDTNERFFDRSMQLSFIEPDSRRLRALLRERDHQSVGIIEQRVQHLDPSFVDKLEARDILFVDSSHVSKAGSDVNHILFELLPRLKSGVIIHFHDVLYPFEYPRRWFELGVSWNEPYLLRAFLQYNSQFTIRLWNDFVMRFHTDTLQKLMPLCVDRPSFGVGGSLWLQKV